MWHLMTEWYFLLIPLGLAGLVFVEAFALCVCCFSPLVCSFMPMNASFGSLLISCTLQSVLRPLKGFCSLFFISWIKCCLISAIFGDLILLLDLRIFPKGKNTDFHHVMFCKTKFKVWKEVKVSHQQEMCFAASVCTVCTGLTVVKLYFNCISNLWTFGPPILFKCFNLLRKEASIYSKQAMRMK